MSYVTATQAGYIACTECGRVHRPDAAQCTRCYAHLSSREPQSLQKVWAYLLAGIIAFIPANIYLMINTKTLTSSSESTILGGVMELAQSGSYGIAVIVFAASILIPLGKFLAISFLAISVQRQSLIDAHARQRLYEIVEFIGRWSMIDVFVVAILSALVQLEGVATITPGIAALSFSLSVIFTMLSAQSFDARLIWDAQRTHA
jgi:paraquat-inducible protein A